MTVRWAFFDVGETLFDETRYWGEWAQALGVPRLTFFGLLGAVIARGAHHQKVFEYFDAEVVHHAHRQMDGLPTVNAADLYPDAAPCLRELRARGVRVGVVGNQPGVTEGALRHMDLAVDLIASSSGWGVRKPDPAFFERVVREAGCAPGEVAYVGDRLDNDAKPAQAAGLLAVHLRRGPWGYLHAHDGVPEGIVVLDGLRELPDVLAPT